MSDGAETRHDAIVTRTRTIRVRVSNGAAGARWTAWWVVPRGFGSHYARCARDPASLSVLRSILGLVGYDASAAYLGRLSLRERVELEVYATREYASASDNPVQRHPRPSHLPPPWRGHAIRIDRPTLLRAPTEEG